MVTYLEIAAWAGGLVVVSIAFGWLVADIRAHLKRADLVAAEVREGIADASPTTQVMESAALKLIEKLDSVVTAVDRLNDLGVDVLDWAETGGGDGGGAGEPAELGDVVQRVAGGFLQAGAARLGERWGLFEPEREVEVEDASRD